MTHAFLDHATPIPFVHRGGPAAAPENTLLAFDRAHAMGFRYFETDVHTTSDGVLVAFHDRSLKRLTGERVPISSLTAAELTHVRVEGEAVPLLDEVLSSFPDVRINIDPKTDSAIRPLVRSLRDGHALERVCLASFNDQRLRWLRAALGHRLCTAAGPREIVRIRWAVQRGRPIQVAEVDVLQIPTGPRWLPLLDGALVDSSHCVGIPVHVWTINEAGAMARLLDLGVDGIMSDDPVVLREVFQSYGIWPSNG